MTLTDAGPLVALIDADEADHTRCRAALDMVILPMVTTWPAFTEAMYLLGRGGWRAQEALWRLVGRGDLQLAALDDADVRRAADLMRAYADRPMDLADATLVVLAERRGHRRIFTLDSGFHVYRLKTGRRLSIFPE
ncbi:MAG: type II toxin-antitoxin system VapC family toxin [Mycobacteriales bacterium]